MALHFILVRPKEPGNVGASARAMKNFGYKNLRLVAPQRPLNKNAYAFASHAGDVLDNAPTYPTLKDALENITVAIGTTARVRKHERSNYTAKEAADLFTKLAQTQDIAILFGPEDWGLSNDDLDQCQGYIQIPTDDYASLNLGQAVQVLAYEFFQSELIAKNTTRKTVKSSEEPQSDELTEEMAVRKAILNDSKDTETNATDEAQVLSSRKQIEGMYEQLHDVAHLIGYTDENRSSATMRLMRRIFDKATLTERELKAIRGLWRQVTWATKDELKDKLEEKTNTKDQS